MARSYLYLLQWVKLFTFYLLFVVNDVYSYEFLHLICCEDNLLTLLSLDLIFALFYVFHLLIFSIGFRSFKWI